MRAKTLSGQDSVSSKRYWDARLNQTVVKVLPGEFYVTGTHEIITTVLGSCISACIYDEITGVGGMNHFMLPEQAQITDNAMSNLSCRYGSWAMECLVNALISKGGNRERLKIKLFGGGRMLSSLTDIGSDNIRFAQRYIQQEGLALIAHDLGGIWPRKLLFYPKMGKVRVKKLTSLHQQSISKLEHRYQHQINRQQTKTNIELF